MRRRLPWGIARAAAVAILLVAFGQSAGAQLFGGGRKKAAEAAQIEPSAGGMTATPGGSIIISLHQYQHTTERVVEILPDGRVLSFPNAAISRGEPGAPFAHVDCQVRM